MKWMMKVVASAVVMSAMVASAQSLGEAAREQKAQPKAKKAKRVYTNDDLPAAGQATVNGAASLPSDVSTKTSDKLASNDDRTKRADEYKVKINVAKAKIADLQHEIDLMDREYKMRGAIFYADAGNRLRDDKKWADQERKYKEESVLKKNELQASKDKLESLREEARKSGVTGVD